MDGFWDDPAHDQVDSGRSQQPARRVEWRTGLGPIDSPSFRWRSFPIPHLARDPGRDAGRPGSLPIQEIDGVRHKSMPPSTAYRSISAISSGVKERPTRAATFCSNCSKLLARISTEVTHGSPNAQAIAICASDCPRPWAMSLRAFTRRQRPLLLGHRQNHLRIDRRIDHFCAKFPEVFYRGCSAVPNDRLDASP